MKLEKFRLFRARPYTTKTKEYKIQLNDVFFKKTISAPIPLGETWIEYTQIVLKEQGFKIVGIAEAKHQNLIFICKDTHLFLKNMHEN